MIIYTSEKVMPYVYMGIHKTTGQFYIGSRTPKSPSHSDIFTYRTSSKYVKPIFDEFEWVIIAEFFNGMHAYDYEQELIHNSWGNPLMMNRVCHYGKSRFNSYGITHTDEAKAKISKARKGGKGSGHPCSEELKAKLSTMRKGKSTGPRSETTKAKLSVANKGKRLTDETKAKIAATQKQKWKEKLSKK